MKRFILFGLLLSLCCTLGYAQSKETKNAKDGFKWVLVWKFLNSKMLCGAEDCDGNVIVPTEYSQLCYFSNDNPILAGFGSQKGEYWAWYSKNGKCIIPHTKGYTWISKRDDELFGTYYTFRKKDGGGIIDVDGREILSISGDDLNNIGLYSRILNGKRFYYLSFTMNNNGKTGWGIADTNGNILCVSKDPSTALDVSAKKLTTTTNPLANNRHEGSRKADTELHSREMTESSLAHSITNSSSGSKTNQKKDIKTTKNFSDAIYFGLKGNVKKCEWAYQLSPLENYPWPEREILFSPEGKIILDEYEFDRDSSGRILKIKDGIISYIFTYDGKNRINSVERVVFNFFGDDSVIKYFYTYDSEGRIISSTYNHNVLGEVKCIYNSFTNDSKGNWIKCSNSRTFSKTSNKGNYTPKRVIEYY